MKHRLSAWIFLAAGIAMISAGCETTRKANKTQKGAAIGTASGAVIGGVIGNNVGNKNNTVLGSIIGAVVGGVAGGIIGNKMDRQAEAIKSEIPGAEVTRVGEGINVVFNEKNPDGSKAGVYFGTNMSNINANSQLALDKLVKVFKAYPETNILIEGHTDDVGDAAYNETLSQKRATTVGNYIKAAGISASRLTIKWYGETQPKVDNSSDANRAENRRVEFAITANDKMKEEAAREAANKN
ncbi:MAG TPA: OmpA family protein [Chitinophagaceae bacterium]|jgi:outer membrane protein OmpA-like peptidoglycan-associated protein|nr:OmpA family protein [Chitinophagaceae bacterium]